MFFGRLIGVLRLCSGFRLRALTPASQNRACRGPRTFASLTPARRLNEFYLPNLLSDLFLIPSLRLTFLVAASAGTLAALFALPGAAYAQGCRISLPKDLAGCWLTTQVLGTSNARPMGPAQARGFVGSSRRTHTGGTTYGASFLEGGKKAAFERVKAEERIAA